MAPNMPSGEVMMTNLGGTSSDFSTSSGSLSPESGTKTFSEDFNAPIYPSKWRRLHDRSWVLLTQAAQLFYLVWRWHRFITKPSTLPLSLPFIIAETLIVFGGSFITYFLIWNQVERPKLRLEDLKISPKDLPTVDVVIPCYNEPVEIVRRTTLAVLNMDYPPEKLTICICDDGNSAAMRALVAQIKSDAGAASWSSMPNLRYIARKKIPGVPHHAKAGNINNALLNEGTEGDFIVVFDCDMECKPHFLQAVLPHFLKMTDGKFVVDEKVAMVQSPQSFTNVPENDPLGQQYRYFYGPVLRGWDAVNSTPCCGTNVTFSRKALLSIGGFTYGSITEDFLTSMTLHSNGYRSKYVHEYLAAGLSPETVHDFYKQRFRWAAGGLQIFKKHNALTKPGLTVAQRFLYFWSGFNTCLSIPMIYLILCPIIYLIGQGSFKIATFDTYEYFVAFGPYMLLQMVCMKISYRGVPSVYLRRSFQESVFMLFCYARAVITVVLGLKLNFKVTSKDADTSEFRKSLNWVIPHIIYMVLAVLAIILGGLRMADVYKAPGHDVSALISNAVSLFWISLIAWQMWPPVGFLIRSTWFNTNKAALQEERV